MPQSSVNHKLVKLNLDSDYLSHKEGDGLFIKNNTLFISNNNNLGNGGVGIRKPHLGNIALDLKLPDGTNKTIGAFECRETNEIYFFNYNSAYNHHIGLITDRSVAQIVARTDCFSFSDSAEYGIPEHNVFLKVVYSIGVNGDRVIQEKMLLFTDGLGQQRQVNIIASLATDTFRSPYFRNGYGDRGCSFISLATIFPYKRPEFTLKKDDAEINYLLNKDIQLATQFVYVDGRTSIISPYSQSIQVEGEGCFKNESTLFNYVELELFVGSAFVEKILLYKRSCDGDWVLYDIIYKHTESVRENPEWWNRSNEWGEYSLDIATRTIKYNFYNNKKCAIVSQDIFTNISNQIPFASKALTCIGDRIILGNNKRNFNNLTQEQKTNFEFNVETKKAEVGCDLPLRNIKIYIKIEGNSILQNQSENPSGNIATSNKKHSWFSFLYKDNDVDEKLGKVYYGGLCMQNTTLNGNISVLDGSYDKYKQEIPISTNGFVGTLNGEYVAVSRQVKVTDCNEIEDLDVIKTNLAAIGNSNGSLDGIVQDLYSGQYEIYQCIEFKNVKAGFYSFMLHSHENGLSGDFVSTSTNVYGWGSKKCGVNSGQAKKTLYEWTIDVRNDDYDSFKQGGGEYMIVRDVSAPQKDGIGCNVLNKVIQTYLYEDKTYQQPIENAVILQQDGVLANQYSDKNGYIFHRYWKPKLATCNDASTLPPASSKISLTADFVSEYRLQYKHLCTTQTITQKMSGSLPKGLVSQDKVQANISDSICSKIYVRGKVKDINGNGIGGILIWTDYRQPTRTKSDGSYEIVCHDSVALNPSSVRNIYIGGDGSKCNVTDDNCNVIDPISYVLVPCISCEERVVYIYDKVIKVEFNKNKSVYGKFTLGVVYGDVFGRMSFVNKLKELDINDTNDINSINWVVNNTNAPMPDGVSWVSFFITRNLRGEFVEWVSNEVKLLNTKGEIVKDNSSAMFIAFDIESLIKFNITHDFGTNTIYQFREGDTITILSDGQKEIINPITLKITGSTIEKEQTSEVIAVETTDSTTTVTTGTTNNGSRIIIPYDVRLSTIGGKCGVKIRINRPYECEDIQNGYFEASKVYDIDPITKIMVQRDGTIDYYNLFKTFRNIIIEGCTSTANGDIYNSFYRTDFVPRNCRINGRYSIENEFVEQRWHEKEIAESYSWVNGGEVNGLANFSDTNIATIDNVSIGGIVGLIAQKNIIFAILENDWVTLPYGMNYLQVTEAGTIEVPINSRIGKPHQKIGNAYGCSHKDKNSIKVVNDLIYWVDSKNKNIIACDYQKGEDITDGVKTFVMERCMTLLNDPNQNAVVGYNPLSDGVLFTFRKKYDEAVNNRRCVSLEDAETISFNNKYKVWDEFISITPEYYAQLNSSIDGLSMFAFENGIPFIHNSNKQKEYLNFFGVQVQPTIKFVVNTADQVVKNYINIIQHLQGEKPMFVDSIETEEWNSLSYIPSNLFIKKENVYYADFLRDMVGFYDPNKPEVTSKLHDGKRIFGRYAVISMVMPLNHSNKYWELQDVVVGISNSVKQIKGNAK